MIAVDANLLVYAHRSDSEWFQRAATCLTGLAEGGATWAIPWPCVHEFLAIVTNTRIFRRPTPLADALTQVECWLECPTLELLSESGGYWDVLSRLATRAKVRGGSIHDARIAALCLHHGVKQLWSADRDFLRFPELRVVNPLLEAH